jgi:hypothetical protein
LLLELLSFFDSLFSSDDESLEESDESLPLELLSLELEDDPDD